MVRLPHDGVYTRLKISRVHGIGVFAIRAIPKGTNIFGNDKSRVVWVERHLTENIAPELKKFYADFCIVKNGRYGCPENFNMLTFGWYLNNSKKNPNVRCTARYDFIALRNIKKNEELLVDYSTFNKYPQGGTKRKKA